MSVRELLSICVILFSVSCIVGAGLIVWSAGVDHSDRRAKRLYDFGVKLITGTVLAILGIAIGGLLGVAAALS